MQKSRRQTSRRPSSKSATPAVVEFNPDYTYIKSDLKRIGVLAGSFFALLIILSFILPLFSK
jgi:hypothetical protein